MGSSFEIANAGCSIGATKQALFRSYSIENRVSHRASKLQEYTDTESLEVYVKGAPADHLHGLLQGNNASWQHVHRLLRHYGLPLEKGGTSGSLADSPQRLASALSGSHAPLFVLTDLGAQMHFCAQVL